ncbi:SH3 domain-containing protein [Clostridium mediterraneense]|uniref:SH3 domain-containing protein n=1 Tax=Clostridium mediterraneense TaxID=1805472 RepID=UPI00082D878A|nr:SH3 domain-containing protein [Clostridium mediterraneense]
MLKHKITSIIMGALMLSGIVLGGAAIHNTKITNDNTKVVNKVLLAAPSSLVGERAVVVNTDNSSLVLYSKASESSNITSYISVGEMLTIEDSGDNFYKVKVQETGAVGYISAHNLQIITSGVNDAYNAVNKKGYIINVSSRVNLRANATMSSNVLAKLTNNTKLNVLGKQGQWYKVNCNGTVGYIYQEYIGLTNNSITNIPSKNVKLNTGNEKNTSSNISNKKNTSSNSNVIENTVYTDPTMITFVQSMATPSSSDIQVIKYKSIPLKVLEKVKGSDPGAQNPYPTWYKVETQNGQIGYIAQNETYYKKVYTNPNRTVAIQNMPNGAGAIIKTISHKKEQLYVIDTIKGAVPGSQITTTYYKVRFDKEVGFIQSNETLN